ncbi:hypothetical protein PAXINDRAFT_79476 [Paxillus involutus ATCC 200175]|uniref:DNA polymerase eta n=1 Tax=Paxillus involutus ATCC 200175 TaxID=664439 RepID=A0A0C9SX82_PAXIN|nr:hypothetical protein PAXINDRAFT_79476 [Paxillus involutus ATCC 200175]
MNSPSKASTLWKGKGKVTAQDYDDLRPTITYRHLFSHNLGAKDPLRVIALCDSDAFYAACERVRLGLDPSVPLVVQQWESLIAVSYPAREFGISRMDKTKDAKKKCPNLVAIHVATYKEGEKEPGYWDDVNTRTHKVSLDLYRRESNKIINLFKEALPSGEIEKASIDEAFIDFTRPVRERLLERFPYLGQVPPDAPQGPDSPLPPPPPIDWNQLGVLIPIAPAKGSNEDELSVFEDDHMTTWHDVALSIAAEFMGKIREEVHEHLGYSMSAGIARNKFLAKLSASYKKPNSQSILRNDAIPNYLRPLGFQKIRFLGGKLGDALAKEYDVSTVGDLLGVSLDEMQNKFGENAMWVYELLRGIDRSEVKEKSALFKSMLASKNLPEPITKPDDGHQWIRVLAAELALRLNDAREKMPTLWPKTIVLHARKGYETSRSKQSAFPFSREVTVDMIAAAGDKLWKELIGNATIINVGCVQLAFTGIETAEMGQQNIEGFFKTKESHRSAVKRPRSDSDGTIENNRDEGPRSRTTSTASRSASSTSFVCERCRKRIFLREVQRGYSSIEEDSAVGLAKLRVEHDDFHFAQDLANGSDNSVSVKPSSSSRGAKRKKEAEPKGIAKFFIKK